MPFLIDHQKGTSGSHIHAISHLVQSGILLHLVGWRGFFRKLVSVVSLCSGSQLDYSVQSVPDLGRFLCRQNDWSQSVCHAEYAQNSLCHSATRLTPFECVLGRTPSLCPWDTDPTYRECAHTTITWAVQRFKQQTVIVGWKSGMAIDGHDSCLDLLCKSLWPCFTGTFIIYKIVNHVSVELKWPPSHVYFFYFSGTPGCWRDEPNAPWNSGAWGGHLSSTLTTRLSEETDPLAIPCGLGGVQT